jgi:integrase
MSITIDKDKRVHLRFRYTDKQGIVHQKHFSKSEWKLKRDAKEFQDAYLLSVGIGHEKLTVNELYGHYIKEHQMKLKSSYNFNSVHRLYIQNSIGKLKVSEVNQSIIKKWQKGLTEKELSNRYIGKIQDLLRTVFLWGVRHEYIERNPFLLDNVQVEEEKKIVEHWTPKEFEQFIKYADNQDFADFFTLLYWTGLRYGEAVALTVKDFDSVNGTIAVTKTWDSVHKVATSPKTHNSYRTVVCTTDVKMLLSRRLAVYAALYGYDDNAILFGFHTHLSPSTMQHAFERYMKKSGVKRINIHALRHSHVFVLREAGLEAHEIAKRLGHTVEMVNEVYGQYYLDHQKMLIEKLDENRENVAKMLQSESDN